MAQPRAYFVNRKMQTEVQRVGTLQSFPKLIVITPLILQTHNLQFIKSLALHYLHHHLTLLSTC